MAEPLAIRAITICVNYDDILQITLPTVLPHVEEMVVVTSLEDLHTQEYVTGFPNVRCLTTDAFYRNGARFNKGLAMEEGFDFLGREGWILILDADIILPPHAMECWQCIPPVPGKLYTPHRRILAEVSHWPDWIDTGRWAELPRHHDRAHYGYHQLFHASDPVLRRRPWYSTVWTHAGRADDEFQHRWPADRKARPGFEVLHLGRCDENWFGRTTTRLDGEPLPEEAAQRRDLQARLRRKHGWGCRKTGERLEERVGHQEVPVDTPRQPVKSPSRTPVKSSSRQSTNKRQPRDVRRRR